MRKLVLACALLFALGVAFLPQPAVAIPLCDCEFCSAFPNVWCWDDLYVGFRFRCYEYTAMFCP